MREITQIKRLISTSLSLFVIAAVLVATVSCSKKSEPKEEVMQPRDIIIALDTSLSMVGKGGENIMPRVKESLTKFVKSVNVGDSLTFLTFDTTVRIYPTVDIRDDNDKEILNKYLSVVEAKGQWTFTMEMLRNVLQKAEEIETQNKEKLAQSKESQLERKLMIVIMTDALDDPPPAEKDKQLNIKELADEHSGQDWFIYFVNLGSILSNEQMAKFKSDLAKIATTEIITPTDPENGGELLPPDVIDPQPASVTTRKPIFEQAWFYLLLIFFVILAAGILYGRHNAKVKLYGRLEYRNRIVLGAQFLSVNLDRYEARRISIGRDSLCQVRIPDFESHVPVVFEAAFFEGELQVFVNTERGIKIKVVEGQSEPYLKDNTRFEVGGYEFVYHSKK